MSKRPSLLVVGGPNGSGKTSVAEFLANAKYISHFLNADLIAKGLEKRSDLGGKIESGRVLLDRLHNAISHQEDVSFESTLSGRGWIKLFRDARSLNYEVTICFVAVESPELAIHRVHQRVGEGGHFVSDEDVRRRFFRSLRHFFEDYVNFSDNWYFFDNSGDSALLLAYKENGSGERLVHRDRFVYYKGLYGRLRN